MRASLLEIGAIANQQLICRTIDFRVRASSIA
jgi:hypothetical protein